MTFGFNTFNNCFGPCVGLNGEFGIGGFGSFMPGSKVSVKTTGGTGSIFSGRSPQVTTISYERKSNWFLDLIQGFTFGKVASGGFGFGVPSYGGYSSPYGYLNNPASVGYAQYNPNTAQLFGLGQYGIQNQAGQIETTPEDKAAKEELSNLTTLANGKFNIIKESDGTYTLKHKTENGVFFEGDYNTVRTKLLQHSEKPIITSQETTTDKNNGKKTT